MSYALDGTHPQSDLAEQEILQLTEWLETLDSGISALLRSHWWKIGSTAEELYRKATFQGERVADDESLEDVLWKFRIWRGDRTKRNHGMKDGGGG